MRIAVLGAGSWGTTLAILLNYNVHEVVLWAHRDDHAQALMTARENSRLLPGIPIPEDVTVTSNLEFAVAGAELIGPRSRRSSSVPLPSTSPRTISGISFLSMSQRGLKTLLF
jgi:hypothetical protein